MDIKEIEEKIKLKFECFEQIIPAKKVYLKDYTGKIRIVKTRGGFYKNSIISTLKENIPDIKTRVEGRILTLYFKNLDQLGCILPFIPHQQYMSCTVEWSDPLSEPKQFIRMPRYKKMGFLFKVEIPHLNQEVSEKIIQFMHNNNDHLKYSYRQIRSRIYISKVLYFKNEKLLTIFKMTFPNCVSKVMEIV